MHSGPKVGAMDEAAKAKIRAMSQSDIPIEQRRALYNKLGRRMESGTLKPGLLPKYQACAGSSKARFELLKEFLIDPQMSGPCIFYFSAY